MITIFNLLGGFGGSSNNIYPDDAPTFTLPETLVAADASVAGILFTADLNGANHIVLSGNWVDAIQLNAISGQVGDPVKFKNENSSMLIGTSSKAASAFGVIGTVNNIEVWGNNKDEPFPISAGSGQSGFVFNPTADGTIVRIYNAMGKDNGYSTVLFTANIAGTYRKDNLSWIGDEGVVTEGEHIYLGNVSTRRAFDYIISVHCHAKSRGREGIQIKWTTNAIIYNHTYRTIGQVADTAQQHAFQWEACNAKMYDMIFDKAKRSFNIFAHGCELDGFYLEFTGTTGYIGVASDFFPGDPSLNGQPVILRNGVVVWRGGASVYLAQWAETGCNFEIHDTKFYGNFNTNILQDIRVGGSNSFTNNGNTFHDISELIELEYKSDTYTSKDFNSLVPGSHYFNLGWGKATPPRRTIEIVDAIEEVDESVVYDTPFGDLTLPSTGRFMLSTGKWITLPITWAEGAYVQDVAGTYRIYGTPTGYTNTGNNRVEKDVTVEAYVNPDTVRINLGGTGASYVSTGNWNNIFQSFSSGAQTIKGDNSGDTLASLRRVGGTLTGYGLTINTGFEGNITGEDSGGGVFPDAAIIGNWLNPGSAGTGRSFKFTGLDPAKTYVFNILASIDAGISGASHLTTIQVAGASGGGTFSNQETKGNKTNILTYAGCVPTAGGEITITVTKTATGQAPINVIEFSWT